MASSIKININPVFAIIVVVVILVYIFRKEIFLKNEKETSTGKMTETSTI